MKRVQYSRGSINSTIGAAQEIVCGTSETRFVFATANGYTIESNPAQWRDYYKVTAAGVELVEYKFR